MAASVQALFPVVKRPRANMACVHVDFYQGMLRQLSDADSSIFGQLIIRNRTEAIVR